MSGEETIIDSDLDNRQARVIKSRYSINCERQTLSAIGKDLGLSRERVRQLENEGKQKFYQSVSNKYADALRKLVQLVRQSGGILTRTKLAGIQPNGTTSSGILFLLADVCPDLRRLRNDRYLENGWVLTEINFKEVTLFIEAIVEKLRNSNEPLTAKRLKAEICNNPYYDESLFLTVIRSTRNLIVTDAELVGLKNDRLIDPKTVAQKVYYILNKCNRPLHFSEIARKVSSLNNAKEVNESTIHNELIAGDEFVLVGRGIYALKKWGYAEGTIVEVILDFLKRQEKPQSLESILLYMAKERMIKKNTVMVNLVKNKSIAKTETGEYYIKQRVK